MRRRENVYRLLALAGVLGAVAWGCSTDSPTAPVQTPAPPDTGGPRVYRVTLDADPNGIVFDDESNSGSENTRIRVRVTDLNTGRAPADGTLIDVTTSLGSFETSDVVQRVGLPLANGEAFLTLYASPAPSQRGVATVSATLQGTRGSIQVPIEVLVANFFTNNPEGNLSVRFVNDSRGNPTRFRWDFGDGTGSSLENPSHEYEDAGTYNVVFEVFKTIAGVELSDRVIMQVMVTLPEEEPPPPV